MRQYADFIDSVPLIDRVDAVVTTGDPGYPGTALEVCDPEGRELFHVVVNAAGEKHVLFLAGNYRLTLSRLEEIIAKAKKDVRFVDET